MPLRACIPERSSDTHLNIELVEPRRSGGLSGISQQDISFDVACTHTYSGAVCELEGPELRRAGDIWRQQGWRAPRGGVRGPPKRGKDDDATARRGVIR